MLNTNTMRFGTDQFAFTRTARLKYNQPLDTAEQTSVEGFSVTGDEPAGSTRRFLFDVDGTLYKFANNQPVEYSGSGELEDVLENGNTAAEVESADVSTWLGRKIYPIIALKNPIDATQQPTANISLSVRRSQAQTQRTVETAEYELASDGGIPRIESIAYQTTCLGNGNATVQCKLLDAEGNWSDNWLEVTAAKDQSATAIKFLLTYNVQTLDGTDSAKVDSITVKHTLGSSAVSGQVAELYSVVQDYHHDLRTCYVVVKHKKLIDSKIAAKVNFMTSTKHRSLINIGTSTGNFQTLSLEVDGVKDSGIDQTTIQLFADGLPLTGFGYNVADSTVSINVAAGKTITASYDYDHAYENWQDMTLEIDQQPYEDGSCMTRFTYTLPDDDIAGKKVSNVQLILTRPAGTVSRTSLGVASGTIQMFVLPHAAKQETIELNADWSYNADSQILTVVGQNGVELILSYDWLGESQMIYSWAAGWSVA